MEEGVVGTGRNSRVLGSEKAATRLSQPGSAEPKEHTRSAFLMLTSGPIVATSVPFCIKMFSTFITGSLCSRGDECQLRNAGTIILGPTMECGGYSCRFSHQ